MPTKTDREKLIASRAVARPAAIVRGLLWASLATIIGVAVWTAIRQLQFSQTAVSNSLVEFSIAVIALPFAILGIYLAVLALRWIGLGLWPGSVGTFATPDALLLLLGPFGNKRYDVSRLDVRYPFELSGDDDGGFEAFLPEEEQKDRFLPRLLHPDSKSRINLLILKFVAGPEDEIAKALRPAFDQWRTEKS